MKKYKIILSQFFSGLRANTNVLERLLLFRSKETH